MPCEAAQGIADLTAQVTEDDYPNKGVLTHRLTAQLRFQSSRRKQPLPQPARHLRIGPTGTFAM